MKASQDKAEWLPELLNTPIRGGAESGTFLIQKTKNHESRTMSVRRHRRVASQVVAFLQGTSMTSIEGSNCADATALFGLYEEACLYAEGLLLFEVQDVARLASVRWPTAGNAVGSSTTIDVVWLFGPSTGVSLEPPDHAYVRRRTTLLPHITEYVPVVLVLASGSHSVA